MTLGTVVTMVRMGENICADKRKPVMVTMKMTVWTKLIVRTTVLTVVIIRMTTIRMTLTVVFTVQYYTGFRYHSLNHFGQYSTLSTRHDPRQGFYIKKWAK